MIYPHDQLKPTKPDEAFAARFAETHPYGFYLRRSSAEDVQRIIDDPERWVVLNINPQSVSFREPAATAVTVTQEGGKIVESRGVVLRYGQISGTTGYLPKGTTNAPVVAADDPDIDIKLGRISGFAAFHRLRHLFRLYGWERSRGNLNVTLHYIDIKGEEFWRIEPQDFAMRRTARQPYSYTYDISFTAIEPSDAVARQSSGIASILQIAADDLDVGTINGGARPVSRAMSTATADVLRTFYLNKPLAQSVDRLAELRRNGLGFVQTISGAAQRYFQNALRYLEMVLTQVADVRSAFDTALNLPLVLLKQTRGAVDSLFTTLDSISYEALRLEVNDWGLEVMGILDDIQARCDTYVNSDAVFLNRPYSVGMSKQGFNSDFMPEVAGNKGTPDANPYIGRSGLALTTNYDDLRHAVPLQAAPIFTGDTIWSLAQRLLGSVQRFVDLIVWNNLEHPYIVSDATRKPQNTLAWGESILTRSTDTVALDDATVTEAQAPAYSSVCSQTGTGVELIDGSTKPFPWRTDQWSGYTLTLRPGSPTEEVRVVVSNDASRIVVNYAWTVSPALGDSYVLQMLTFSSGRPVSPEARAYGRDILAVFRHDTAFAVRNVTFVYNSRGDIASVQGESCLMQAIQLRGNTEVGAHPFHPLFGVPMPVGRPWSQSNSLLYSYYIRRSFLRDTRIADVRKAILTLDNDVLRFSAEILPKQARRTRAFNIASVR